VRVVIGILVRDGAATLGHTLESLLGQSLLVEDGIEGEIHVVANGSRDGTVALAERTLAAARELGRGSGRWAFVVHDLAVANKCRAWEAFVHELSPADADHLVLMDCDILLGDTGTVARLVRALDADPDLDVATSFPVKDVELAPASALDRVSARVNDARLDPHAVCGQLYAGRAAVLRRIHMPIGLRGEDGFIRAMVLTDGFRSAEQLHRIRRIDGARHVYEAHTAPSAVVRHETWLVTETVLLSYLYAALEALPLEQSGTHAGELVAALNDRQAGWFDALFVAACRDRHPLVPRTIRWRRLRAWWSRPWRQRAAAAPKVVLTTAFDAVVCRRAERVLEDRRAEVLRDRWISRPAPVLPRLRAVTAELEAPATP
jgi:glycosyltransferase involved in cell wall biosynthesis